jgi:hypothetical protein
LKAFQCSNISSFGYVLISIFKVDILEATRDEASSSTIR